MAKSFGKDEKKCSDIVDESELTISHQNLHSDQNAPPAYTSIFPQSDRDEGTSREDFSNVHQNMDKLSENGEQTSVYINKKKFPARTDSPRFQAENKEVVSSPSISPENTAHGLNETETLQYKNSLEVNNDVSQAEGSLTLACSTSPIRDQTSRSLLYFHKHELPRSSKNYQRRPESKLDVGVHAPIISSTRNNHLLCADVPEPLVNGSSTSHARNSTVGDASEEKMPTQAIGSQETASVNQEPAEENSRSNPVSATCHQSSTGLGRFPRNLDVVNLENDMKANLDECLQKYEESKQAIDRIRSRLRELGEFSDNSPPTISRPLSQQENARNKQPATVPVTQTRQAGRHPITLLKGSINQLPPPPSYDECMNWTTSRHGQGEGASGGARLDKPPDYRSRHSQCWHSSQFGQYYHPEFYTRFIHDPAIVDTSVRRPRQNQTLQRRHWAVIVCPCLSQTRDKRNDHMTLSLLAFILCWPIGLAAIYYSYMCQKQKRLHNYARAQSYGNSAFATGMIGVIFGLFSLFTVYVHKKSYI